MRFDPSKFYLIDHPKDDKYWAITCGDTIVMTGADLELGFRVIELLNEFGLATVPDEPGAFWPE